MRLLLLFIFDPKTTASCPGILSQNTCAAPGLLPFRGRCGRRVTACVDTVGIRSNFRERARKMAPSGGVSGSVLGRVAVELQHLQWVDVIRSTAKTSERYVMSCMRNLHTILVQRVISGELFRFLGTNLETKHLVSDSWVIALCFYSWSSDQPKSETGLKPRFPQNRFSMNPVDI